MSPEPRSRRLAATAVALSGLLGSLLGLSGCGAIACFEWDGSQGDCPDRTEARQLFLGVPEGSVASACGGKVVTVDGDPSYDGEICCYGVTYRKSSDACN